MAGSQDAPAAFSLDIGVLEPGETALIECNDAWALGYYRGTLSHRDYIDMLWRRWDQIARLVERPSVQTRGKWMPELNGDSIPARCKRCRCGHAGPMSRRRATDPERSSGKQANPSHRGNHCRPRRTCMHARIHIGETPRPRDRILVVVCEADVRQRPIKALADDITDLLLILERQE